MAWTSLLQKEQIDITIDDENKNLMFEVNSGGAIPRYITLHIQESEISEIIEALEKAKAMMKP